jgi:hypothetical protein
VGRFGDRVIETTETVAAKMIGNNQDDIWRVGHRGILRLVKMAMREIDTQYMAALAFVATLLFLLLQVKIW